jgi:hypothetical protein
MGTGSSPARRILPFSESAEKLSLLYELMPLKPSASIPPGIFQYLFQAVVGSSAGMRMIF